MIRLAIVTAITGFMAVAMGAFGAHGLKPYLDATQMETYRTAVLYHLVHAVAMLTMLSAANRDIKIIRMTIYLFLAGVVCFSGSLYLLATGHMTFGESLNFLGPVTPLGGLLLMAGWLNLLRIRQL